MNRLRPRVAKRALDTARAFVVIGVASLALASSVASLAVLWLPHASLGFAVSGRTVTAVAPNSAAARAGMHRGDTLASQTPIGVRLRAFWYDAYRPGQTERLTFGSAGRERTATLSAVEHRPPFSSLGEAIVVLRVLLYVVFVVVGTVLVLARPARFTWGFFLSCIGLAIIPSFIAWSFTALDPIVGLAAYGTALTASALASVGFLAFALCFPSYDLTPRGTIAWRSLSVWFLGLLALYAWSAVCAYQGWGGSLWADAAIQAGGFLAWLLGSLALWATYRSTAQRDRRRLQWVIVGCSLGYLAWYLDQLLASAGYVVAGRLVGVGTLAMPLSVAYAVLKHRVIALRFVVNRALAYSIVVSVLVAALAFSSWLTAVFLISVHLQIALQIGFAVLVGASLQRAYAAIAHVLERALFRDLREAEDDLTRASLSFATADSRDAVDAVLIDAPVAAFGLEHAAVFRRVPSGDFLRTRSTGDAQGVPEVFAASEPVLQVAAGGTRPVAMTDDAVALVVGRTAHVVVFYGPHRNGYAVDPDELIILEHFVAFAGPAYDRLTARATSAAGLGRLLALSASADVQLAASLADFVFGALLAEDARILAVCAAVPDASADDVAHAAISGDSRALLADLVTAGFVTRDVRGCHHVHPLLKPIVERTLAGTVTQTIRSCAERSAAAGEHLRAAELYDAVGDRTQVLVLLNDASRRRTGIVDDDNAFTSALDRFVRAASPEELASFPELLLERARRVWPIADDARLRAAARLAIERLSAEDASRSRIALWLAYASAERGELDTAIDLVERFDASGISVVRAVIAGKQGDLQRCEALTRLSEERASPSDDDLPRPRHVRSVYVDGPRGRAPVGGDVSAVAEARHGHTALERAVEDDIGFSAWVAGERATFDGTLGRQENAHPRFVARARIAQSLGAEDTIEAQLLARLALDAATKASEPFLMTAAHICLFELHQRRNVEHIERAAEIAARMDSPALREAIAALVGGHGDSGTLGPLVRLRNGRRISTVMVEVATASVRRGPDIITVPERELALLVALAVAPRVHATATLTDALWPDLDEANAAKALQTCVYRVRLRLGDARVIESVAQGYQLGRDVGVDLLEAERFLGDLGSGSDEKPYVALRLTAIARHFGSARPAATLAWEWYDRIERRVASVAREAQRRLAERHLRATELGVALAYAREMLDDDPLDEGAREIAIRAHLAADNVAEAWRELRLHREVLAREVGGEATTMLGSLLSAPDDDARTLVSGL